MFCSGNLAAAVIRSVALLSLVNPEGQVLTIGLAEAQERLGSLIELAEEGEVVCIMRRGRQVAQITSIDLNFVAAKAAADSAAAKQVSLA